VTFEEVETGYLQGQSIKRFVEPEEIADLCLASRRMISGQAIGLDGHTETYRMS
jgi:hypothetical protein